MDHDAAAALLLRHAEAYRRRDAAALAADYTADASVISPMFPRVQGREAIERSFVSLFRIFPDWEVGFEPPVIDGGRAMQRVSVRATQSGEFMGIPGTGRRLEFTGVLDYTLRENLIEQERRIYDFTGVLIQLGILRGKI